MSTLRSPAREAFDRFFPEPPQYSVEDLGIAFRHGGRRYFLESGRVAEVTRPISFSLLPGSSSRGVAFWRGRAHEVQSSAAGGSPVNFILIQRNNRDMFVTCDDRPVAARRSELPTEIESFPEEA